MQIDGCDWYTIALINDLSARGIHPVELPAGPNSVRTFALVKGEKVLIACEVRLADLDQLREMLAAYELAYMKVTFH